MTAMGSKAPSVKYLRSASVSTSHGQPHRDGTSAQGIGGQERSARRFRRHRGKLEKRSKCRPICDLAVPSMGLVACSVRGTCPFYIRRRQVRKSRLEPVNSPVHPVGNVESSVQTQRSEVVRRDRLGLARSLKHKQLRQDRDALEPDGESPSELERRVSVVEEQRQDSHGRKEIRQPESIQRCVLRRPGISSGSRRTQGRGRCRARRCAQRRGPSRRRARTGPTCRAAPRRS